MDELTKNRLTGAIVWLGLLIWLVPQWYSNPVNYPSLAGGVKSAVDNLDDLGVNMALPRAQDSKEVDTTDNVIVSDRQINRDDSSEVKEVVTQANSASSSLTLLEVKEITEPGFYVRLISYQNPDSAVDLEKRLVAQYNVSIGSFTTSAGTFYTVRVGPYPSLEEASLAKTVLDRELRIESIILDRRNQ